MDSQQLSRKALHTLPGVAITTARLAATIPLFLIGLAGSAAALYFSFYACVFVFIAIVPGDHGLMDEAYIRGNALWLIPASFLAAAASAGIAIGCVLLAIRILDHRRTVPQPTDGPG